MPTSSPSHFSYNPQHHIVDLPQSVNYVNVIFTADDLNLHGKQAAKPQHVKATDF